MKKLLVLTLLFISAFLSAIQLVPYETPRVVEALPSPSGALSPYPADADFSGGESIASSSTNYDFSTAKSGTTIAGWTITGSDAQVSTPAGGDTGSGYYLQINGGGCLCPQVISSPVTLDPGGQQWTFYTNSLGDAGATARVEYATGPSYTNWTQVFFGGSSTASGWVQQTITVSSAVGQSIEIMYASDRAMGFDDGAWRTEVPGWTVSAGGSSDSVLSHSNVSVPATTASNGDFSGAESNCTGAAIPAGSVTGELTAGLRNNAFVTSTYFTVPSDSATLLLYAEGATGPGPSVSVYLRVASDNPPYSVKHTLFNKQMTGGGSVFGVCDISFFAGQSAQMEIHSSFPGEIGVQAAVPGSWLGTNFPDVSKDPVSFSTGAVSHKNTDIAVPGKGVPLEFSRVYTSAFATSPGSLGWGWVSNYDSRLTVFSNGSVLLRSPDGVSSFYKNVTGTLTPPTGLFDSLIKNGDNTYTLTTTGQVRYNYDTTGKLVSIKDRNDNTTSITYDGNGFLSSATDPGGRQLVFTPDASGRITQVAAPMSRTIGFAYDANGDLFTATDVKGGVTTFAYSHHHLTSLTDSLTHVVSTNIYDAANRVAEQRDGNNNTTCFYYGSGPTYSSSQCVGVSPAAQAGQTIMVDPRGNKEIHQFDTSFRPTGIEDALGHDTTFTYEATGALCSPSNNGSRCAVTDALGHSSSTTYDSKGNVLTVTNPLRQANGSPETGSQCGTNGTGNGLDDDADTKKDDGCPSSIYTYTSKNDIDLATDALGRQTDYIYDTVGNLTRVARKDGSGVVKALSCYERDTSGLVVAQVESTDLVVPAGATDPCNGNRTLFAYDSHGNQTCLANPRFTSPGLTCSQVSAKTTFAFDLGGRLQSITDELHQPSGTGESGSQCGSSGTGDGVDDDGDNVADDGCPSTVYTYDNMNEVVSTTDANGTTTINSYDAKGQLTAFTDGNRGAVGTAESGGQCGTNGTGNGVDDDGDGVIDDGCPSQVNAYDVDGHLVQTVDPLGKATSYGLDPNGNRTSVTNRERQPVATAESGTQCGTAGTGNGVDDDSDGVKDDGCPSAIYAFDVANHVTSETDALGHATSYEYFEDGTLKQRTDARGLVTKYFYDAAGEVDHFEHWNGATLVDSVAYAYDDDGNRLSMVDSTGTTSYQYDALNRVTSVTSPGPNTVSYRYDNTGAGGGEPVAAYPGQRTKITYPDSKAVTYTYEADGNMKSVSDWLSKQTNYTYDSSSRLAKTTLPNGVETTYAYDRASRILSIRNRAAGADLATSSYNMDPVGNRTSAVAQPAQDYRSAVLNDGPVAYWRLGEASGTTAVDQSANHLDGTYANGAVLGSTGALSGDSDPAVNLDGTNDQVNGPTDTAFNSGSFTIEAWAKPSLLRVQGLVVKNATTSWRVFMSDTSGHVKFDALNGTKSCVTTGTDTLSTTAYSLVSVTYDKTAQEVRIYLNGALRATCGSISDVGGTATGNLQIGATATKTWKGNVDEVAYFNYAVPQRAIANHYYYAQRSYRGLVLMDQPQVYWRLGEASGTVAKDESFNHLDGTYQNTPTLGASGAIAGDTNTAMGTDGVNDQMSRAAASALNSASFSIELWAQPNQLRAQGLVFKNYTSSWRLFMNDTSGHIEFDALADLRNCTTSSGDVVPTGAYTHIVATYDQATQEMRIYLNGSMKAKCTSVPDVGGTFNAAITVGANSSGSTWDGKIDEVAYFNYALPPKMIADHYAQKAVNTYGTIVMSDAPQAYWRLGDASGTTATDETSNRYHATYANGIGLRALGAIAGDANTAVNADGTDDQITSPTASGLNSASFSIEVWAKPDQLRAQGLVFKNYTSSWRLFMNDTSGHIEFDALADLRNCATAGTDSLPTDRYTHVVATYDKNKQEMRVYLNGVVKATCSSVPDVGGTFSAPITIGANSTGSTWDGKIDEVAYYAYALSPEAVKFHYGDQNRYSYDADYQLTGVVYPNGDTQAYTYDVQGNRLTKVNNGSPTTYTYDDADQTLTAGGVSYGYDNNGNTTSRGADAFGWDHENRMISSTVAGANGTYIYNGDGVRTSRTLSGSTVTYRWDSGSSLPSVLQDSANNTYVYGRDLISRTDGTGTQAYYLADGLGSTTNLSSSAGALTDTYAYDVFGAQQSHTGSSAQEFTFAGEQVDGSGLQYLRARYYDASTGRFTSRDPVPYTQRYAYAHANPVRMIDPTGLRCPAPPSDCGDVVRNGFSTVGGAIDTVWNNGGSCILKASGPYNDSGWCIASALLRSSAGNWAASKLCAEGGPDNNAYRDFNFTGQIPGIPVVLTGGIQLDCKEGKGHFHPYRGLGFGGGYSISTNVGPGQHVTPGVFCGASVGVQGLDAQFGGTRSNKGDLGGFWELGANLQWGFGVSVAGVCAKVD